MSNRSTSHGRAIRRGDFAALRAEVLEALQVCEGNNTRAAHWLGIHRRQLIRYINRVNLVAELDAIRAFAWETRYWRTIMDEETMKGLCAAYQGMEADEIEAAITSSQHAALVPDPAALAAYIYKRCQEG